MIETGTDQWTCDNCGQTAWIEYHGNNPDCLGHVTFGEALTQE